MVRSWLDWIARAYRRVRQTVRAAHSRCNTVGNSAAHPWYILLQNTAGIRAQVPRPPWTKLHASNSPRLLQTRLINATRELLAAVPTAISPAFIPDCCRPSPAAYVSLLKACLRPGPSGRVLGVATAGDFFTLFLRDASEFSGQYHATLGDR